MNLRSLLVKAHKVDLSHELHEAIPVWPGAEKFKRQQNSDYADGCRVDCYQQAAGIGTHMDAPAHFIPRGRSIEKFSLEELIAPACVIDVRSQVSGNCDYALSVSDIQAWENSFGMIPKGSVVLLLTGWSAYWQQPSQYQNQDAQGEMHFPGFSAQAAEWLVKREVVGVGIDTLSLDPGQQKGFPAHHIFLGADKYQLENLTNLEHLPSCGATLFALPIKVRAGVEASARVIAVF